MRGWLLDTNVLAELRRSQPNTQVMAFVAAQPAARLFVSAVTLAEIRFGIELIADPERRAEISAWLTRTLPAVRGPGGADDRGRRWCAGGRS